MNLSKLLVRQILANVIRPILLSIALKISLLKFVYIQNRNYTCNKYVKTTCGIFIDRKTIVIKQHLRAHSFIDLKTTYLNFKIKVKFTSYQGKCI